MDGLNKTEMIDNMIAASQQVRFREKEREKFREGI